MLEKLFKIGNFFVMFQACNHCLIKCRKILSLCKTCWMLPTHRLCFKPWLRTPIWLPISYQVTHFLLAIPNCRYTMLQKLSKCEVKAWLCRDLIILPPFRFYMKSNLSEFKQSKNVILGNFGHSELRILKNLGPENCSNLLKSKFRTSKIGKNNILDCLNSP